MATGGNGQSLSEKDNDEEEASLEPERGQGKFVFPGGAIYEGEYMVVDGVKVRHGDGKHSNGRETYVGRWDNDAMHGEGEVVFGSDATYRGWFANNKFDGFGRYEWGDGAVYEGNWKENKMHGHGCYTDSQKNRWEGEFCNGLFDNGRTKISLRR